MMRSSQSVALLLPRFLRAAALTSLLVVQAPLLSCDSAAPAAADDPEANLPGDIDNSTEPLPGNGKADAWDFTNDPARLANNLNYELAALPRTGKLDKPVWAARYPSAVGKVPVAWSETYWPSISGSTNNRWQGASEKSALEKYDQAFNSAAGCATMPTELCGPGAKAAWEEYFKCAGPAATWQIQSFQSIAEQFDGIDNDADGETDECDSSDDEGTQGWWGLCHAWTPAALLEPEPAKSVTYNGVTFAVSDIKALVMTVYDRNEAMMLGGRCNAKTFDPDNSTSQNDPCYDSNPGALHVVLTNFLGINDNALAMDKTAGWQVWNQPIVGYSVSKQDKVTTTQANVCVGATGDVWTFNPKARDLYEVEMNVNYLVEGGPSSSPLGMDRYVSTDTYHYILEVGSRGKVIGGRYCTSSEDSHPDFLWAPIRVSQSSAGRNPSVSLDQVQTLINLSFQDAVVTPTGTEKVYEASSPVAIPDGDVGGVTVPLEVPDTFDFTTVSVGVDITHTWRGDLAVKLLKDGVVVKTLFDREGGSAHDLVQTWTLMASELAGPAAKGTWALQIIDDAAQDTGTLNKFKLAFAQAL